MGKTDRKYMNCTFRPSSKVKVYLSLLGYVSSKSGRKAKESASLGPLINAALVRMLEAEKNPYAEIATPLQLKQAWLKWQIGEYAGKMDAHLDKLTVMRRELDGWEEKEE